MASTHISIRIEPKTLERLERVSRRERMTRSEMVKTLIEEGLRMMAHPGIVFRPGPTGRRAGLARGPDVWEVMNTFEDPRNPSEADIAKVAESLALSTHEVRQALGYYAAYRDEIEGRIRLNDEAYEEGYAAWLAQRASLSV